MTKDPASSIKAPNEDDHVEFAEKLRGMFLPADVFPETSRKVVGIVERGDFSLTLGRGKGLGLVSAFQLMKIIESQKEREKVSVLMRVPTSLVYVKADVGIL